MTYAREKIESMVLKAYEELREYEDEFAKEIVFVYKKGTISYYKSDGSWNDGEQYLASCSASSCSAYLCGDWHWEEFKEWCEGRYDNIANASTVELAEYWNDADSSLYCAAQYKEWDEEIALNEFIESVLPEVVSEIEKNL